MAIIASSASGSICEAGAVAPAVRAAIMSVTAWPITTTAEPSTITGSARRVSSPSRTSPAMAIRSRAQREPPPRGLTRPTSNAPIAVAASASATSGIDDRTGDGSASSTATVITTCTTCPAARSHATARSPRPTSSTSRPWLTPR